ncbi:hypothetical protein AB9E28_35025, partial [Rhizobium leguminosarum]|uniref:hypothetical protein n=1 Tax=Rhizobium leguminosarum TaxID=384 RepID=UPI003F94AE85
DLPVERRSIGALRTFLNNTDPECIASRLRRWERGGPLGWKVRQTVDGRGDVAQLGDSQFSASRSADGSQFSASRSHQPANPAC